MNDRASTALKKHALDRAARKHQAVLDAIHALGHSGADITVSSVARAAQVSREFIHSKPDLHRAVRIAADRHERRTPQEGSVGGVVKSLQAERRTLIAEVDRQRTQNKQLREQVASLEHERRQRLGDQLSDLMVDPQAHSALRIENDRLSAANSELSAQLLAARRNIARLERELAASRQAHAEDMAAAASTAVVTPITAATAKQKTRRA